MFAFSLWALGQWAGVSSIVMLMASEVAMPYYGRVNLLIDQKKLRIASIALGILFLLIAIMKIASIATI